MKSAEQLIADYLQPSLRPDIDAGSLATYLVRHLRDYGWRLARYTEAQAKDSSAIMAELNERCQRAHLHEMSVNDIGQLVTDLWAMINAQRGRADDLEDGLRMAKMRGEAFVKEIADSASPLPRHLSPDMLQVYCAALTGLIAAGADRDGAVRGAMMCVEATALATK